jgi:CubicO group peptidase (beta-lactamase class C family)
MRWRLGYHQAFVPRTSLPRAFGHYGYAGSGGWADPDTGMALAFVSNRLYPVTTPFGDLALLRLSKLAVDAVRALAPTIAPQSRSVSAALDAA